jgi:hypothetical protein
MQLFRKAKAGHRGGAAARVVRVYLKDGSSLCGVVCLLCIIIVGL